MSSTGVKEGLPPIPDNIGEIAGSPYLGILLNWWLFGILTLQYYLYYINFPDDRRFLKLSVHFIFFVETLQTIFTVADGFHWFVFGFGDMNKLGEFFLANFDTPIMSGIIALVVQGMYAWRVYRLSKLRVITGLIILCAVAQLVGALGTGILNQQVGTIAKIQSRVRPFQIIWTLFSATADILIASAMTWLLLKSKQWKTGEERNNVITKIVRLTIETNLASAAVAVSMFLTIIIPSIEPPKGSFFLGPSYVLGKLYSNSFMAMLNNRTLIKQDILRGHVHGSSSGGSRQLQWSSNGPPAALAISASSFISEHDHSVSSYPLNDFKKGDSHV